MTPSIFDQEFTERLLDHGLQRSDVVSADIWVMRSVSHAKKIALLGIAKKIVAWSSEPRWDSTQVALVKAFGLKDIHVFNIFTGEVFWHNRHFLTSYHYLDMHDLGMERNAAVPASVVPSEEAWQRRRTCLAVSVYHPKEQNEYFIDDANLDLKTLRQDIALQGARRGLCDVVGQGWPDGLAIEASGFGDGQQDWWTRKMKLLTNYKYSIALENTVIPNYVTEKIWQAIRAGVLPVYYGGGRSTIYDTFPEDSFIDCAKYPSIEAMLTYMDSLSYHEWVLRLTRCIAVYNEEVFKVAASPFDEVVEAFKARLGLS